MESAANNRVERFAPLPENVVSLEMRQHHWHGARFDVHEQRSVGRVSYHLCYENETRLSALLEEVGTGRAEPRLSADKPCTVEYQPRHMTLVPAGMDLWGHSDDIHYMKDATIAFDLDALEQRFEGIFKRSAFLEPRIRMADERIASILQLLSDAVGSDDPSVQLYGDGLIASLVASLMSPHRPVATPKGALAQWQVRRITSHLHDRLPERVDLAELASLAGLSPAHFSRAFKLSTGLAPYQWQLDMRVRRAQELLETSKQTLDEVADACGFADGSHFARTFKRFSGCTPSEWRRRRL
ncbi:AraC family transcriptional regulator [Luteibacter aegosomaticola]|uniref:helix-turn-helix domain-containing protein n=1 Tax=Luteibacter aegosomaticola TaxID=2911538 RepID=UPI001FFB0388|nr:AraC family transcriptional regulator [Luteibacter aegosomaticola]UPG88157.1 AraC family transcriptional regulator [Luteibacter aegosomaticola]